MPKDYFRKQSVPKLFLEEGREAFIFFQPPMYSS